MKQKLCSYCQKIAQNCSHNEVSSAIKNNPDQNFVHCNNGMPKYQKLSRLIANCMPVFIKKYGHNMKLIKMINYPPARKW